MQTDGHHSQEGPEPLQTEVWGDDQGCYKVVNENCRSQRFTAIYHSCSCGKGKQVWRDTHEQRNKCEIFPHHSEHLIEGDVLITRICYCQLSSASISKTTVTYINCLLSGP